MRLPQTTTEARLLIQTDFQVGRNWLGMLSPDRGSASDMFDGRQASKGQITLCSQPCNTKIHEPRDSKGLANLRIPSKAVLKEHSTDKYDMSTNARLESRVSLWNGWF